MASDDNSYEADRELWRKIYKTYIFNNDSLDQVLEDQSLYWNDDKEIVDTFVLKTIKRFDEKKGANQELLPEILSFPNIPVSVSLNEYVEIAKLYSTSKSGSFINGTLDGIVNQLKKEGKLTKN